MVIMTGGTIHLTHYLITFEKLIKNMKKMVMKGLSLIFRRKGKLESH